ncbi:hypothetical protein E2C01_070179 [Portunus trituberculatus]|uniref:Uncharacterized protein n=1 Tax=Portunus trituberculatus TaxID=210409 RepID=A0A5B7I0L7_PORTR|nr:hypothetical protein [Portunus trituberculatus]
MEDETENISRDNDSEDSRYVEEHSKAFGGYLEETPIVLPLLLASHNLDVDHACPPAAEPSRHLYPDSYDFPLSEILESTWQDSGDRVAEADDRLGSLSSGRSLSVSFGDVTVCGRQSEDAVDHTEAASVTPPLTLDDLPYIDDIILNAASPVLGAEGSKTRHRSLAKGLGSIPEWLASKGRLGSLSSLVSRSSLQDVVEVSSLPRDAKGHQGINARMTRLHRIRLATGDHRPRVLKPSVSLETFGDWKDVENPTLTVSVVALTHRRKRHARIVPGKMFVRGVVCATVH